MKRAAKIEDGQVVQVIVGTADWAQDRIGGIWVDLVGLRAGRGWTWEGDHARPPKPFPSWTWDGDRWLSPVPYPDNGLYRWDEDVQQWVETDEGP